jgi:hypothetical protein
MFPQFNRTVTERQELGVNESEGSGIKDCFKIVLKQRVRVRGKGVSVTFPHFSGNMGTLPGEFPRILGKP